MIDLYSLSFINEEYVGEGRGLNREGNLINFLPLKRRGLLEGGAYLRGAQPSFI